MAHNYHDIHPGSLGIFLEEYQFIYKTSSLLCIYTAKTEAVDLTKNLLTSMHYSNKLSHIALPYSGILLQWAAKAMMEIN